MSCPDAFIYTKVNEDEWKLHIIEFKRTIDSQTYSKSKWQFTMGIYNARAVAAFLGIKISCIQVYTGYRADKIAPANASLIALRTANSSREVLEKVRDWQEGSCCLKVDNEN